SLFTQQGEFPASLKCFLQPGGDFDLCHALEEVLFLQVYAQNLANHVEGKVTIGHRDCSCRAAAWKARSPYSRVINSSRFIRTRTSVVHAAKDLLSRPALEGNSATGRGSC